MRRGSQATAWRGRFAMAAIAHVTFVLSTAAQDVSSAGALPQWRVSTSPTVRIGMISGDSGYLLSGVAAARLLPDHGVVVADRGSNTIRVFRADGTFVRQMGRSGQGPGEFEYLYALSPLVPPDTVIAFDPLAMRLTTYLVSGTLVSTLQLEARGGRPETYIGSDRKGRHMAAWIVQGARDRPSVTTDVMQVGLYLPDGHFSEVVATAVGMRRGPQYPMPFSGHFLKAWYADTAFVTDGLNGVIQVITDGKRITRTISIPLPRLEPRAAWRRLEGVIESPRDRVRLEEAMRLPGADSIPVISEMLTDDSGYLWLKRYDPATDSHWVNRKRTGGEWLVVTRGGSTVARVLMPERFRLLDVSGGLVVGVSTDDLGVERVDIYTLARK